MTELAFLSVEVDNDAEAVDEESECSDAKSGSQRTERNCQQKLQNEPFSEENGRKETVEICQQTVNPNNRVGSENFMIQRVIGKGGYGKVFLVQKVDGKDKGKLYAMKVLKKARLVCNEKDKAHTVSERNILQMLRHPFLVRLHYAFQNHSNLYIVLEYCPGGELFNYLEREGALLENAACFYTAEIILAIGHLHSLGIIYRDLKSENVLLDRQGHVKLTDFGLSKEGVGTTNTFCGTIEYMAPEIIRCEGHGKAVDWWSLGTLLYDMLSGAPPFSQEESKEATTHKILTAPLKFPPAFSPEVVSLIRGLLRRDPKERLGSKEDVEEVKRHKFFRRHEINWSDVFHRRLRPPFRPKLAADNDVSMFDPTFTRLQPVVSPAENSRPIPPDMFQGFSYVGPSVCEEVVREPWVDADAGTRRRQYRNQAALSAGRLRRMELAPSHWNEKPQNRLGDVRPAQPVHSELTSLPEARHSKATGMYNHYHHHRGQVRPNSTTPAVPHPVSTSHSHVTHFGGPEPHAGLVMPSSSRPQSDGKQRNGQTETTTEVGYDAVGDADTEVDEEAGDDEEDNEEEVEEENVPGAKHIQGSRADLNPSFGVRTGESAVTAPSDTHRSANFRAFDCHTSTSSRTHPSRSRLQIVPATAAYRRLGAGTLDTRGPVVGSGLQLSVSRCSVPDSHRTPILAAPKTSPTSGLVTASSANPMTAATSNQTTSTSNSKCCTM
ncbi:hypothetical protein CRM22_001136 [Opisthorchis felineus]|uniref:non-specific serine/threonine protein kinase n=1 Tax=Opisthorchis felineus TaxID=147828 RepID=A0A4S2MBY0_OPIFE|nr:hypothetical protein CRM22_001136 [Opisthorchis felineus]